MKRIFALVVALTALLSRHPPAAPGASNVRLLFYDRNGAVISATQARSIMNGAGVFARDNDALIAPPSSTSALREIKALPLFTDGTGHLAFAVPGAPAALEFNWPTTRGYSMLILDNGGPGFTTAGTVNVTYQGALDAKRRLDAGLAARPTYVRSTAFQTAYDAAVADIAAANGSSDQSVRGKYGYLALDQLAVANDLMLSEYGVQYAKSHPNPDGPWLGVTEDTTSNYTNNLQAVSTNANPYGWVRIVFDYGQPASAYLPMVQHAKSLGLRVMGQPIDSSDVKRYTTEAAYEKRVTTYVDYFTAHGNPIDAWEVGNEANGEWTSSYMPNAVAKMATYAKQHSSASTVLTLYWQIGTGPGLANTTFNWADQLKANPSFVSSDLDVVLLSIYQGDAPMGLSFDQVFGALGARFPDSSIGTGELGYWEAGTTKTWWYCTQTNPTVTARHCVADQFYRGGLGYANSLDGVFWWFGSEELANDPGLQAVVSGVRDAIK